MEILNVKQSERFESLDHKTKQIVGALLENIYNDLSRDIRTQTAALSQLFNRRDMVLIDKLRGTEMVVDAYHPNLLNEPETFARMRAEEIRLRDVAATSILDSLRFEFQTARFDRLSEAHGQTFGWIYRRRPIEQPPWDSFVDWLERDDGLYWVNGKAGSGKSTLMKYVSQNSLTREHLSKWARGFNLVIAEFYFWNPGTELQKSQAGLLRYLLFQILGQVPDLIPIVFPEQWGAKYASASSSFESKV